MYLISVFTCISYIGFILGFRGNRHGDGRNDRGGFQDRADRGNFEDIGGDILLKKDIYIVILLLKKKQYVL